MPEPMPKPTPKARPIQHYFMFSDLRSVPINEAFEIIGPEAHHAARVKRIRTNEQVGILDGQGHIAGGFVRSITGSKSKPTIMIELSSIEYFDPPTPRIEVWSALPKGDRLERMIDQLSQIGVCTFRPLLCDRSQRKPETVRMDKLERIALESAKQCRRPWTIEFAEPISFADALKEPDVMLADASGTQIVQETSRRRVVLLIGPEGGWSDGERDLIVATSVPVCRFGLFVLRIEAAACAASAILLASAPPATGTTL